MTVYKREKSILLVCCLNRSKEKVLMTPILKIPRSIPKVLSKNMKSLDGVSIVGPQCRVFEASM